MRTIFVTGTDTGVGKTRVTAALARLLTERDEALVQLVKPVETGRVPGVGGDAEFARSLVPCRSASTHTLRRFAAPLAPLAAAAAEGAVFDFDELADECRALPACDWRIVEGAGGVAVPLAGDGRDWLDFAAAINADVVVLVVPDRLGVINQARLAHAYAVQRGVTPVVWLNGFEPVSPGVSASNREGLRAVGLAPLAETAYGAFSARAEAGLLARLHGEAEASSGGVAARCAAALAVRDQHGTRRRLTVNEPGPGALNLAGNDYLRLRHDPAVVAAATEAARRHGTSAAASPLVTGWGPEQAALLAQLCLWHGRPHGMLWSSGYAANAAILGELPRRGDLVLADRLIHHSMIAGLLRSGARLRRYAHLDLDQLERELAAAPAGRTVFVVTESVFSMDGDRPDLVRMAELKRRHGFFWIVDEAHALGWYGPGGAGLAAEAGVAGEVDVLVGTLGKALASGGAYSLFNDAVVRDHLVNHAGEFVYSTGLPPASAAAARAALSRVRALAGAEQADWRAMSRRFRARLAERGWSVPDGDSPIVPVRMAGPEAALRLAAELREAGVVVGAIRPPTVPAGTSRLRFSLKRGLSDAEMDRVCDLLRPAAEVVA
ncbi:MAG: dethiobiotin synthase [Verrucomicrobiota bacterium]